MSAPPVVDVRSDEAPAPVRVSVVPLLRRLHFYAGVLVAPFLLVAAISGMLYAFAPQFDRVFYGDLLEVSSAAGAPRPLAEQVAAAQAVLPDGAVTGVQLPDDPTATTRVVFSLPGLPEERSQTVYVDPYTAQVVGQLTTWFGATPVTAWLDNLHANLHLGETGALYSELAASWLWVVALGGLVLWLARRRTARRRVRALVVPEKGAKGVRKTRSWHASVGVWVLLGALFLSATGLTWSNNAGANFDAALTALNAKTPALDTGLRGAKGATSGDGHGEHGDGSSAVEVDPVTFDRVLVAARGAGLDGPLELGVAAAPGTAWTAAQTDNTWPVRLDKVAVDPATATVTARADFADRPVPAKLSSLGIQAHMGVLFGVANQLALFLLAAGILTLIVLGYRMWWQRRPTRADRRAALGAPPRRGAWQQLPLWVVIPAPLVLIALGWAIPLLGLSLLAFLLLDGLVGAARRRARDKTGTAAGSAG
ncbi:PepSY-associated TM helix domain-containing protein [Saccharothrix texasensis]|uniref:Putative iron-regulated membrane protein n=1 Tax=Saccharothrix texasensis TaxID=103734 RepID=A0A3N1GXP5_9PSEU|nr:PepSY-associated TM helix domain-containing protein [Saccharothrix texasensis]ROP35045.1 putative iron-regulated membrane protein [Saccharothrix texasensis]